MNNLQLFGKRIKELRKVKKVTQEQLAEIIGLDSKQIGNIETGSGFTTMSTLEKLASFFDVEISELFSFAHQKSRQELIESLINQIKNAKDEDLKTISKILNSILK
ncbi:helix-turn-helix transcriptional regulator [bacterium]|nr:helix-turn-helix transcriptional regulator [bacterium]